MNPQDEERWHARLLEGIMLIYKLKKPKALQLTVGRLGKKK